jgi:predicted DNA-binding transcriptional regulator AlpA
MSNPKKLIRLPDMCVKYGGCNPSTIWRRVADGTISRPIKVGGMTVWDENEEDRRIEAKFSENEPEAA